MHELYKQGKILAIGMSTYLLEQINVFRRLAPLHTSEKNREKVVQFSA